MTPKDIVAKFADALDKFKPTNGQPSDTKLTRVRKVLTTLLLHIPYDKTEGTQNMISLIRPVAAYTTRYRKEFAKPACIGDYDTTIDGNDMASVRAHTEVAHKAKRADRGTYETARSESAQFILAVIEDASV